MARSNDMMMEDELTAAFIDNGGYDPTSDSEPYGPDTSGQNNEWAPEEFPGQLAVDVYETSDKLIIKARTAGINKSDLDVSISDNILTISGVLSGGEEDQVTRWHLQECYWGEFSRTIALPAPVQEEGVKAELKEGVLTISFEKEKVAGPKVIPVI